MFVCLTKRFCVAQSYGKQPSFSEIQTVCSSSNDVCQTPEAAFVSSFPLQFSSFSQFIPSTDPKFRPRRYASAGSRRCVPIARMRRGFKPDPKVPKSLCTAAPETNIDFEKFDFACLAGKVVLVMNVASKDIYTEETYRAMKDLLDKYHESGFELVLYPNNWFGQKETGSNEEIKAFIASKCGDAALIMNKVDVDWSEVFALGTHYFPGEIIWNFHGKFLFNRNGVPVQRFDLLTPFELIDEKIQEQINGGFTVDVRPDEPEFDDLDDFIFDDDSNVDLKDAPTPLDPQPQSTSDEEVVSELEEKKDVQSEAEEGVELEAKREVEGEAEKV